jgi:superfamily I DNA/RNA helicase
MAIRLSLTQSFRFGPAIAERANRYLEFLGRDLRVQGFEGVESTVEHLDDPDAIICRTNAGVIANALEQLAMGREVAIKGGTDEIRKFARAAAQIQNGKGTTHADLMAFDSWGEVIDYAQSDEAEQSFKMMVKLVNDHGVDAILSVCERASTSEADADVIVTTAHKAKGSQWSKVKIGHDFRIPDYDAGETLSTADAMLMYVTVTRAQHVLDDVALEGALPA